MAYARSLAKPIAAASGEPAPGSARALAAKAVVLIYPQDRAGQMMWPLTT
jgi:hypothetical protein